MPEPFIHATKEAQAWARDVLALPASASFALDDLQAAWADKDAAISGEAADLTAILDELARHLDLPDQEHVTLFHVRRVLTDLAYQVMDAPRQAARASQAAPAHSEQDCARVILSLCPSDIDERMQLAREGWAVLGETFSDARIIASILCAHRNELHAGDITELAPVPRLVVGGGGAAPGWGSGTGRRPDQAHVVCPGTYVVSVQDEALGEHRLEVALCGRPFTPKRFGQKFGCEACGRAVYDGQVYLLELIETKKRQQEIAQVRKPRPLDLSQCTCGQDGATLVTA